MPPPGPDHSPPIVGLTMSWEAPVETAAASLRVPAPYVDAVAATGAVPLCLPIVDDPDLLARAVAALDAVLFIGAADYRPGHYGGRSQPEAELVPERRDRFDLALARHVLEQTDLPVLGICGGCQLIALACGGGLVQDLRTDWAPLAGRPPLPHASGDRIDPGRPTAADYTHPVVLEPGGLIARIAQRTAGGRLETNSFHHQAVHPERPGRNLRAAARAEDGVVEGVEPAPGSDWARTGRFILGLQWHAERMTDRAEQRAFFLALTAAARLHTRKGNPPRRGRPAP